MSGKPRVYRRVSPEDIALIRVGYDNDIRAAFVAKFLGLSAGCIFSYYRKFNGGPLRQGATADSRARVAKHKYVAPKAFAPMSRLMAGR